MIKILFTVLVLLLAGCAGVPVGGEPPQVSIVNIVPATMTMFEQRYDLTLRVSNPDNKALRVTGMNYTVTLNDQEFARGVSDQDVVIPALGEEIMQVTVTSTALDWLRQIEQIESGRTATGGGLSYNVSGALHLDGIGARRVPFTHEGSLFGSEE